MIGIPESRMLNAFIDPSRLVDACQEWQVNTAGSAPQTTQRKPPTILDREVRASRQSIRKKGYNGMTEN